MMSRKDLNNEIARFWSGDCSQEEEGQLKEFVLNTPKDQLFEDALTLRKYFEDLGMLKNIALDDTFDEEVLGLIEKDKDDARVVRFPYHWAAAAVMVLLLGSLFILQPWEDTRTPLAQDEFVDTYDDPELAYEHVKEALAFVSTGLNEGVDGMNKLGEFHEAGEKIHNK